MRTRGFHDGDPAPFSKPVGLTGSGLRLSSVGALDDAGLLELALARSMPAGAASRLARELLARFGDMAGTISAHEAKLAQVSGLSRDAAFQLKLIEAVAHRLAQSRIVGREVISSWDALVSYCRTVMARRPVEELRVLHLDRKNVLIADEVIQRGTVDHVPVYPREIVKRALERDATALILVHNHPSGDPTPSQADIEMTRRVQAGLETVGIVLHDHIVVGLGGEVSFRAQGLI
jgi:DNA repair protein RadC